MKPQLKEQFKKMERFVNNAKEIARGVDLERLTNDIPYQYSLLYPLGQIGELAIYMTRNKEIEESYTEIVTFKTIENVTKEEFISIVDELEKNFHSLQPGFIDSELLYNDVAEEWIILQHWDSMENMQLASKKMFDNPITETFIKLKKSP